MSDKRRYFFLFAILVFSVCSTISAKDEIESNSTIRKIIFEEERIEGKIRRPQLVLIKADQRPEFSPMVLQSMGSGSNILQSVNIDLITDSPFKGAFQFEGLSISNYSK